MKRIFPLALLVLVTGCAEELTTAGKSVRQIQPTASSPCTFLAVVDVSEGNGFDVADDRRGAMNRVWNETAAMGGNAFVVNQGFSSGMRTQIQAEAFRCPR